MKKLSLILVLVLGIGLFAGCGESAPAAKNYTLESGITLTAESGLKETELAPFTTTLQGDHSMVTFMEENKSMLGDISLDEYAAVVASGNGLTAEFAQDANGNLANSCVRDVDGTEFFYYITIHETGTSFWLVQMACLSSQRETYESLFSQWLATVELPESEGVTNAFNEKTFALDCGLSITMPDDMGRMMVEGYTEFYTNNLLGFLLLQEEKPEGWTLEDYAAAVAEANGIDQLVADEYGVPAFSYSMEQQGMLYHYYVTVHESGDNFYLCNFFCIDSALELYQDYMPAWSASLK